MKTKTVLYSIILIFCALFTNSCQNEDVIITAPGVLHINTLSVIDPFVYQVKKDELQTLSLQQKLNIVLYIFDESEKLVKSQQVYIDSYTEDEAVNLKLNPGNYTVVALSRVVTVNGNKYEPMFWDINSNSVNTSQRTIEVQYLNKYYNSKAAILGVGVTQININNNKYEYNLNLRPAGALLCYKFLNPSALGTKKYYTLVSNKRNSMMKIINYSTLEFSHIEAEQGRYFLFNNLDVSSLSSTIITFYGYAFMLPMENVHLNFCTTNSSASYVDLITEDIVLDLKVLDEYEVWINLKDNKNYNEITYGVEKKTSNYSPRSRALDAEENSFSESSSEPIPLTELINMVYPSDY